MANGSGQFEEPSRTVSNRLHVSATASLKVAGPGGVVRVMLLRFGGASAGSSGCGGSSTLAIRNFSLWTSTVHPVRPWRWRLKALRRSASHCGQSLAAYPPAGEILVQDWQALTSPQGFWLISPVETL